MERFSHSCLAAGSFLIPELGKGAGLLCVNQYGCSANRSPERVHLGAGPLEEQPGEDPEKKAQGSPFSLV